MVTPPSIINNALRNRPTGSNTSVPSFGTVRRFMYDKGQFTVPLAPTTPSIPSNAVLSINGQTITTIGGSLITTIQ